MSDEQADLAPDANEELQRYKRAIGKATGVVNTLNNLLAVMRGHAQLAYEDPAGRVHDLIRAVLTSTDRAQTLIHETFGGGGLPGEAGEAIAAPAKPAKVLVVDDEAQIRRLMQELLMKRGHEVSCAATAEEAMAICRKQAFDIIFMDFGLGGTDGIALARQIRELQAGARVVLLSGYPNIDTIRREVQADNVDGFITKPFDINEIEHVVARLMSV